MRAIVSGLAAMTMLASSALAQTATQGALAPGKPAGTRQAQLETGGILLAAGIVAVATVIAIVASDTENPAVSTSTTS